MRHPAFFPRSVRTLGIGMALALLYPTGPISAATTDLADIPLANATTVEILPNIFFVLDDSGSMDWNWMPDYTASSSHCRRTDSKSLTACQEGDPPWYLSSYNKVYYNPLINYDPPKNADGTSKTSYTTWTSVPVDGYGVQSSSTINLVTSYPERVACNTATPSGTAARPSTGDLIDTGVCKPQIDTAASNTTNPYRYAYPNNSTAFTNMATKYGAPFYYTATVVWCDNRETNGSGLARFGTGTCQSKKTSTYQYPKYTDWTRVDITPSRTSYPGPNSTTRTYSEEMTNFANWYAWYRTRMQMMKTGVGRAFVNIRGTRNDADPTDKNYFHARVGFTTISSENTTDGSKFLKVDNFGTTQKNTWFSRLYAINPGSGTPLLGALSKAGRMYAGNFSNADPIQYSCQRNFTILSTDGYWNSVTASYGPNKEDNSTTVGDQDGVTGVTRPSLDGLQTANTLADVAYYYYHTDLRPTMANNVPPAGTNNAEDDVATHQHMTTFTIGLGVDGALAYQDGYRSSTSGDYYNIKQGTVNWPNPYSLDDNKIDDLWHAAVNGRGTYFSARDPDSLINGLTAALGTMESSSGSGAAAATSNLQPTAGDNYIYIANYRTVYWDGELGAYTIDLSTGAVSSTATWQANTSLASKISSDGNSDTRTIYTSSSSGLKAFTWANLTSTEQAYFDNTKLSQYADWDTTDRTAATGEKMLKYLRGQDRNEDQSRDSSYGAYNRLYRDRSKLLGDIVHSQPIYVGEPLYDFADSGYSSFKTAQASRSPTVYVGANDGMLHAFDAATGAERWAYVPPIIMQNMWRLADKDYATNHRFFVDGPTAVTDIYAGSWKTILVGSLGKGGRGYYALDITNPTSPALLWTYTANDNPNIGYTYGSPMITKVDGTWVVLLPSGYNNVAEGSSYSGGDGGGHLFVLKAADGTLLKTISTGVGSTGNPAGLARINIKVDDFQLDNTATMAYGGDLHGNMWRFDLSAGTASKVMSLGSSKPITVAPEIGEIDGKTVLFFGTGRYLGDEDLNDSNTQSIYAVKDDGSTTFNHGSLQSATFTSTGSAGTSVDWSTQAGWAGDLPTSKERVTLDPQLFFGTLLVGTTIPEANECQPGGYGRVYQINMYSGETFAVTTYTSPPVGITVAKLPGGTAKVYVIEAKGGIPSAPPNLQVGGGAGSGSGSGNRVMWRELAN